jgi:peroxiredoxin
MIERILLILLSTIVLPTEAQDSSSFGFSKSAPLSIGMTTHTYGSARISDIAPEFALPDATSKLWSSRDQLGRQAIVMVLIGESPVLVGKDVTPVSVLASIAQASEKLRVAGVAPVVISRATGVTLTGMNRQFDQLNLRDDKGDLNRFYGASPTFLTVVGIDRAGFLRRIETVRDPSQVGAVMQQVGDTTPVLQEGKPAPDFSVVDMNGRVWRLSELRGRRGLVLSFFPKCFTGGCANHLSSLQGEQSTFLSNDTDTLGVSVDPAEGDHGQLAFAQLQGITFPLVPDTGRNLSILYGAARRSYSIAWRRTMLIDKDGILRYVDKNVNVFTHGADTTAKMRELGMVVPAK